jgi:SAM-dependent methyltransferase
VSGDPDGHLQANRAIWDAWTAHDLASDHYRAVEVVRAGGSTLRSIERDELGEVTGKTLLHLQCNMGADTLSWARLGATVTGIDFSHEAISVAQQLADDVGLPARFITADIYQLPSALNEQFDLVVSTYGTIGFLPDLARWAEVVARSVVDGGHFLLVDIHPLSLILQQPIQSDSDGNLSDGNLSDGNLVVARSYFTGGAPDEERVHGAEGASPLYTWRHSLGDVVTALAQAGLRIAALREYPYTFWRQFPALRQDGDGWWRWPDNARQVPLLYSLLAVP